MNIGFLLMYPYGGQGGTEEALINLTTALEKKNINTFLFYIEEPEHKQFLQHFPNKYFLKQSIPFPSWLSCCLPKFLIKIIKKKQLISATKKTITCLSKKLQIDTLVILDLPRRHKTINKVIKNYKKNSNIQFFSWIHALIHHNSKKDINEFKELFKIYDGHLAISEGLQKEITEILELNNSTLIYNPIPKATLIPRDPKKFIFIGRITPVKQIHSLLTMLTQVKGEWSLDIYGSTGSIEGDNKFRSFCNSIHQSSQVIFHGWIKDPWQEIESAGVLLLNSKEESFGLVLVEAMMRGIPCLSRDCPVGPKEIIKENINGWLYPMNDEIKAIKILQNIVDGKQLLPDPILVQNSVQKFSSDQVADNFIKAITKKHKRRNL